MTEKERADQLIEEICATAPKAILDAVDGDKARAAILVAESYFNLKAKYSGPDISPILDMFHEGASVTYLARYWNVSTSYVVATLQQARIPAPTFYGAPYTAIMIDDAIHNGVSSDFARDVRALACKYQFEGNAANYSTSGRVITDRDEETLKMFYDSGASLYDLAWHSGILLSRITSRFAEVPGVTSDLYQGILADWVRGRSIPFMSQSHSVEVVTVLGILRQWGYHIPEATLNYNINDLNCAIRKAIRLDAPTDDFEKKLLNDVKCARRHLQAEYITNGYPDIKEYEKAAIKWLKAMDSSDVIMARSLGVEPADVKSLLGRAGL